MRKAKFVTIKPAFRFYFLEISKKFQESNIELAGKPYIAL